MIDLKKTAAALVLDLGEKNPGLNFAVSDSGTAIGVWNEKLGKYQTVLSASILPGTPWAPAFDLKVNGKSLWTYGNAKK